MDNPKNAQGPQPKHLIATIKGWNIQRARELIHKHPGLFSLGTQPKALAPSVEENLLRAIFFERLQNAELLTLIIKAQ